MLSQRAEIADPIGIEPFGVGVTAAFDDQSLATLSVDWLRQLALLHKVVVLRGFALQDVSKFEAYCRRWGELLEWPFGFVLDLQASEKPQNYLFTHGNVPYHWDGAFAAAEPSFLIFQCLDAPDAGAGGESLFANTESLCRTASPGDLERWKAIEIEYRTQKVAHYGGVCRWPLVARHKHTGEEVLRFAEPLNAGSVQLNPIELCVDGVPDQDAFLDEFIPKLYSAEHCYRHEWRAGDILIVDNRALLHGRNAYGNTQARRLQRVHVL